MKIVYLLITALLLGVVLLAPEAPAPTPPVESLAQETEVPNTVTGVYLRNRLIDTLLEVLVFAMAVAGAKHLLSEQRLEKSIRFVEDETGSFACRVAAVICGVIAVQLALRGHLSPGGGFAAGVAGGTTLGLLAISSDPRALERRFRNLRIESWERALTAAIIGLTVATLLGASLSMIPYGDLLSGGLIPPLNALVALKVTLGASGVVLSFIRYRGLF